ncbi:MAG: GNAT family N-acetyltransferase [Candidatus Hodarchaeales archaeon]|jgi:GNAT superfamily N-acetyltransferase
MQRNSLSTLSSLRIRLPTREEATECRNIIHTAYEPGRKLLSRDPKVLLKSEEEFVKLANQGRLYVILWEEELIGTFKLTLESGPAVLQAFVILPTFQNRGSGSIVLNWIEKLAQNNSFDMIQLETYQEWNRTNKFYHERGYQQVASFTKENENILVWEKLLSSSQTNEL